MFGVYQLQMPLRYKQNSRIFSEGQRNGKMIGVFLMGAISALIVCPCVAAPLVGALVYISQTHDVVIGGSAHSPSDWDGCSLCYWWGCRLVTCVAARWDVDGGD